ncbi:hypothetical protein AS033_09010 [Exiguobacterium indicum]|uniref:Peptidylprolyl isomerase n=1 Tax=Exiguobacterium indicum TaxID=296995 RepID=A0A0V8GGS4_9BACL|nr:hypothetical protein [Exiguobacterium enclense]KSU49497.1 hypothetical protein AS033_09010 [Exiguobacterium enclense]SDC61987.1 hypothetical protein SAMN05216342_1836 [Exiguobacterium enclense]
MKKLILLALLCTLLSACSINESKLSLTELQTIPNDVQMKINPDSTLQLINTKDDIAYIVYNTKKTITTDLESKEDTVKLKLDESNDTSKKMKQHVFKLTLDSKHEIIDVYLNGKSAVFDNVTGS